MTATVETNAATGVGRVARVIGPVVDVEFGVDDLPGIYNALEVEVDFGGAAENADRGTASDDAIEGEKKHTLTLEVAQHIGDNLVRAISMQPTDGLVRGA